MDYKTVAAYWRQRKAQMVALRSKGFTYTMIAARYKISPQRARQILVGKLK